MPAIETWLQQPAAQAVGWALLQFVWQGAAVGALTALALLALRRSASDVRYVVSSIGLALMLTLPIVTGVQRYQTLRTAPSAADGKRLVLQDGVLVEDGFRLKFDRAELELLDPAAPARPGVAEGSTSRPSGLIARVRSLRLEGFLPMLMPLWLAGVSLLSLRLFTGWLWVQRLRTRGVTEADETLRQMTTRLARLLHIRRAVTLLESRLVQVPTVIGFLKPVVLLPATALAALSAQQIEAILAHELAHIRRHDYLVNLLQTLVETVLFYHPAVWWLSHRIRIERENCCDDLAVSLCGDPVAYATALADLEALRSSGPAPQHHIAMAATGGSLLQRVRRLLGPPSSHSGRGPAWLAATAALTLIGCVAYSSEHPRQGRDQRLVNAVELNQRELRELGRSLRTQVRAVRAPLRDAALTMRRVVHGVLRPGAAKPAIAAAPVPQPRVLPALAKSTAQVPFVGSLPSTIVAAAPPLAPVGTLAAHDAPSAPAAPAAPAAPEQQQSTTISEHRSESSGNWIWSNDSERLEATYYGKFEFTDDDADVRSMSPGGSLKLSDGKWLGRHSVEIRERGGQIEHLYYVNGSSRPYEPEGRAWLQQNLPKFVRNTGIGAESRVARLLKTGGPGAVMTEIGRVDGSYVKGIYYKELFRQAALTPEQYRQAMAQAGREMKSSSYELAQLLIAVADRIPADEASRAAYFQAAGGISSDYEMRRVFSTMLKRGPVSPATLSGILQSARSIDSNYELSELLRQIASQQELDAQNRAAFFTLVSNMTSDYERHRVLSAAVGGTRQPSADTMKAALEASRFTSDYEASQFLQEILRKSNVESSMSAPFFQVVRGINSNYEKGRVLQAVVRKSGTTPETLRAVLQAAQAGEAMNGYELSQLLQAIAANHVVSGDVREAYLAAADRLGDYEQGQAMAALVRSERRK
jgi:beta-lactamase regulating signal transducer with metallopeptidase domain